MRKKNIKGEKMKPAGSDKHEKETFKKNDAVS